jgi:hypothetical protein
MFSSMTESRFTAYNPLLGRCAISRSISAYRSSASAVNKPPRSKIKSQSILASSYELAFRRRGAPCDDWILLPEARKVPEVVEGGLTLLPVMRICHVHMAIGSDDESIRADIADRSLSVSRQGILVIADEVPLRISGGEMATLV